MYVAYDSKDEVWNALDDKIEKEKEYHCPICGGKVIFKQGKKFSLILLMLKIAHANMKRIKKRVRSI